MRTAKVVTIATMALTTLVALVHDTHAQNGNIYQATLVEKDAKTPEISTEQLRRILADNSAMVIDSRTRAEFDAGHIPGAHVLDANPKGQIAAVERLVSGNKAAAIVLYCNGPYCQASRRLGEQLSNAGFVNVRRYQLGLPIWRALGGPTVIELDGIIRIFDQDRTAVYLDTRAASDFAHGTLAGAHNVPVAEVASGKLKALPLPLDDFNRRVVLFGRNGAQARRLADVLSTRPWHNVSYFAGSFETLAAAINGSNGHDQPR